MREYEFNGLKVFVLRYPHLSSVFFQWWFKVGAIHDPVDLEGMAHFVEHTVFKRGKNYDGQHVADEIEALGGTMNAFSAKEYTSFYARILKEDFEKVFRLFSDLVLAPVFEEDEVNKERKVIIEEINSYLDAPGEYVHDLFSEFLWPDSSLGKPILGYKSTVEAIKASDLKKFFYEHYGSPNVFLVLAGDIDEQELKVVESVWSEYKFTAKKDLGKVVRAEVNRKKSIYYSKDVEQIHVCYGGPAVGYSSKDRFVFWLLNAYLGDGMSSVLYRALREENPLTYSVYSYFSPYKKYGEFVIYFATIPELFEVGKNMVDEILRSLNELDDSTLEKIKGMVRRRVLMRQDSVTAMTATVARDYVYFGKARNFKALLDEMCSITIDDVRRVANEYMRPEKLRLVAIGPEKFKEHFYEIAETGS